MIEYQYTGLNADGKPCRGLLQAASPEAVRLKLISQGISPVEIRTGDRDAVDGGSRGTGRRLTRDEILLFTREMAHLKQANMPLDKAMSILKETATTDGLTLFVNRVDEGIRSGKTLYQSLVPFEKDLGRQYLVMIRAGETAGSLSVVLKEMATQLEADARLKNYLISALTYPFILLVVSLSSVVLLLAFVVPQFREIFDSMGDSLPLTTRLVVGFSDFIRINWMIIFILIMSVVIFVLKWRDTENGRKFLDNLLLSIPLLGRVIKNLQFAIYFRTLGMLLQRGVPLIDSLRIAVDTVTNAILRNEVEPIVTAVKTGKRLSESFQSNQFGRFGVAQLIRVAEETGQLEMTLLALGERFEDESRRTMTRVLSTIEPIIIICLGAVVAFIIIAILGGVLSINETI